MKKHNLKQQVCTDAGVRDISVGCRPQHQNLQKTGVAARDLNGSSILQPVTESTASAFEDECNSQYTITTPLLAEPAISVITSCHASLVHRSQGYIRPHINHQCQPDAPFLRYTLLQAVTQIMLIQCLPARSRLAFGVDPGRATFFIFLTLFQQHRA